MPAGRPLTEALLQQLYVRARAERWHLPLARFRDRLETTVARSCDSAASPRQIETCLDALHLEDLALACACEAGIDEAWEHFVRDIRPALLRAADAIDKTGGARELADSLYGELFGVTTGADGARRSLFRYFHGRSSLATWLRAVLAQRYVDRLRATRTQEPLPHEDAMPSAAAAAPADPERGRYLLLLRQALTAAIAALAPRDRLRLSLYYLQDMTLAAIGRLTGEHEATVSRQLARTRRDLRTAIEADLTRAGLTTVQVSECFASIAADPGTLDLELVLGGTRKELSPERSI
jgi:RNA polymerase sigma-70 factor